MFISFLFFLNLLCNLDLSKRKERERLARAVGREIAGWERSLWFGEGGGSWEVAMLSPAWRKHESCCLCYLYSFLFSCRTTARISWYAPSKFCCSTLFHSLVQCLQFLNRTIAGPFPKTARQLKYVPFLPTLAPKSSCISNRKQSVATLIFLSYK